MPCCWLTACLASTNPLRVSVLVACLRSFRMSRPTPLLARRFACFVTLPRHFPSAAASGLSPASCMSALRCCVATRADRMSSAMHAQQQSLPVFCASLGGQNNDKRPFSGPLHIHHVRVPIYLHTQSVEFVLTSCFMFEVVGQT